MTDTNPFGGGVPRRVIAPPEGSMAGLLIIPARVAAEELQLHDQMHRDAARDYPGSGEVLFQDTNDDGSFDEREWYGVKRTYGSGKFAIVMTQAQYWQRLMNWPREPTFAEADQWQTAAMAEAYNALVDRVVVFRERYAECTRLAELGGAKFWQLKMNLPPEADGRTRDVSIPEIAQWLAMEVAETALTAWRVELEARPSANP